MVDANTMESVAGSAQQQTGPSILMGVQYVRSVTFDVHNAPLIHTRPPQRPHTTLQLDVGAKQIGENSPDFEVELVLRCEGVGEPPAEGQQPVALFNARIVYAGLFSLRNSTAETFEPLLLVEAPRMLFPAARNYLADLTREAGFLPVILQQIDFVALWRTRRAQS
ncbi:protein-export chaperone SecB [Acetobacter sp. DsW_063]|uniref:protein-export chaperone SecB n=1 Tax=Acetobacter sp. DsW_063 TaxID=1514894 RepID=UPI000A363AC3|nr:protein-export chaperone SecB [Acetobacter sp. DsW_063]OUJ14699.1 preprotein translocase subunit SecB [Acetobacter sp. DsW_063]